MPHLHHSIRLRCLLRTVDADFTDCNAGNMASAAAAAAPAARVFPPSQVIVDDDGRRWRRCAGACVVNSRGEMLIGERISIPGAWNAPQGGMDADTGESVLQAAAREAHEECGLVLGQHVAPIAVMSDAQAVRYEAGGWLAKEGFAGQALSWALFRCVDAVGDVGAAAMCDIAGLGGEEPEFSRVVWRAIDEVVAEMWPKKRAPYEALRDWAAPYIAASLAGSRAVDFTGMWARDATQCSGVVDALVARGHTAEAAQESAAAPYIQTWERSEGADGTWLVTTFKTDGVTPRRTLAYPLGDWEEPFEGNSTLFGSQAGTVLRHTTWLAEPHADPVASTDASSEDPKQQLLAPPQLAHSTLSETPLGREEARRFLRKDCLILRRIFRPKPSTDSSPSEVTESVSEEVFVRHAVR
eukprot:gnl/TRDRNA2_/TRDRNA2_73574_c0_seq1.p1 gnl/TRDRNA2_/TRDRNA2_73574_c0~~gnl/TRDRNA2_/TRDRNA2_73574_c0_seq1.p1  ORF type:complete len:412 (-),score=80.64 gnl/TRDRNA2_/TRDRNA2_73574_c0_seq1:48-1283(-)